MYEKFLLTEYFTAKNVLSEKIGFNEIKTYVDSLAESIKYYFAIFNPEYCEFGDEIKTWLERLNRLGHSSFVPLILVTMLKEKDEKLIALVLKQIETFIFLAFRISRNQANSGNSYFYKQAFDYNYGRDKLNAIVIASNILAKTGGDNGKKGEEYKYLGMFDLESFHNYIKSSFEKAEGYYRWNGLRYILYEYECHLSEVAGVKIKVSWENFSQRKLEDSIEHIYPQVATEKCWKERFNHFSPREREKLCHSLGNLVLISSTKNSEIQNNCFEEKKRYTTKDNHKRGFVNGSQSEIEVAEYSDWTPETIFERGVKIWEFIFKRYDINLDGWDAQESKNKSRELDMYDLLGLEFMRDGHIKGKNK